MTFENVTKSYSGSYVYKGPAVLGTTSDPTDGRMEYGTTRRLPVLEAAYANIDLFEEASGSLLRYDENWRWTSDLNTPVFGYDYTNPYSKIPIYYVKITAGDPADSPHNIIGNGRLNRNRSASQALHANGMFRAYWKTGSFPPWPNVSGYTESVTITTSSKNTERGAFTFGHYPHAPRGTVRHSASLYYTRVVSKMVDGTTSATTSQSYIVASHSLVLRMASYSSAGGSGSYDTVTASYGSSYDDTESIGSLSAEMSFDSYVTYDPSGSTGVSFIIYDAVAGGDINLSGVIDSQDTVPSTTNPYIAVYTFINEEPNQGQAELKINGYTWSDGWRVTGSNRFWGSRYPYWGADKYITGVDNFDLATVSVVVSASPTYRARVGFCENAYLDTTPSGLFDLITSSGTFSFTSEDLVSGEFPKNGNFFLVLSGSPSSSDFAPTDSANFTETSLVFTISPHNGVLGTGNATLSGNVFNLSQTKKYALASPRAVNGVSDAQFSGVSGKYIDFEMDITSSYFPNIVPSLLSTKAMLATPVYTSSYFKIKDAHVLTLETDDRCVLRIHGEEI